MLNLIQFGVLLESLMKTLANIPLLTLGMMVNICNPKTQKAEIGGSGIQDQPKPRKGQIQYNL